MTTIALILLISILVLLALMVAASRVLQLDVIVVRTSWIPVAALVAQWIFREPLMSALSYGIVVLPLLTVGLGLFITTVGLTLLLSGRVEPERRRALSGATALAFLPVLLVVLVLAVQSAR